MFRLMPTRRFVQLVIVATVFACIIGLTPINAAHAGFGDLVNVGAGASGNSMEGYVPVTSGSNCPDWNSGQTGVYVYSDINYQGKCSFFAPPLYWSYLPGPIGNDSASSLRIRQPASGMWYNVWMYQNTNQAGQIVRFQGTELPDFRQRTFGGGLNLNDNVSSFYIAKEP